MTNAISFLETVTEVQDDIDLVSDISTGFGYTLDASKEILEVPGELEDMLREPATALDLPDPLVSVLGLVPFGIGTAIKTIDRIGDAASDVIEQQADIMGALDDALATPRSIIDGVSPVNTLLGKATDAASFVNGQLQEEAVRLGESLGDQTIEVGFELGERMRAYEAGAKEWFDTRDALLSPFRAAGDAFEAALDELENVLPNTDLFENAADAVVAVMQPIKDAAQAFENAICVDFTITPEITIPGTPAITITPAIPATYITVFGKKVQLTPAIPAVVIPAIPEITIPAVEVDICEIITKAQSGFDTILETVINSALSLVGVDFGAIADELLDKLLGPLQPVFDAINRLKDAAADIIAEFSEKLGPLIDNITDMIDALDNATTIASLFDNTIEGDRALGPVDKADVLVGTGGEDAIYGLSGDDNLTGGGGDFLFGGLGNDILNSNGDEAYGGAGQDILNGSGFSDRLDGGDGDDQLFGGGGKDLLVGGDGQDILNGGAGADALDGGDGVDHAVYKNSNAGVTVNLLTGKGSGGDAAGDTLTGIERVTGSNGFNDKLIGDGGDNLLRGNGGDDILRGEGGADVLVGGAGSDFAVYTTSNAAVTIDLAAGTGVGGHAQGDTLIGIEKVSGSAFNDKLVGDDGDNFLRGNGGDDVLRGEGGADILNGGSGSDFAVYATSDAAVTIDLAAGTGRGGHAEGDTLSNIEKLSGSKFGDKLLGDDGGNVLRGNGGNDVLRGEGGADVLIGGSGADFAVYATSDAAVTVDLATGLGSGGHAEGDTLSGIERLSGSSGFGDTLLGNGGVNLLRGNGGDDTLTGRGGDDVLLGGSGNDAFVFDADWGNDRVMDFNVGGDEILDFSSLGISIGDLSINVGGGNTTIAFDGNEVELSGVTAALQSDDFLF